MLSLCFSKFYDGMWTFFKGKSQISIFWCIFWLRITDESSVPEMRKWSILLIKSDLKWCIHLSRSLCLYSILLSHINCLAISANG